MFPSFRQELKGAKAAAEIGGGSGCAAPGDFGELELEELEGGRRRQSDD